MKIEKIKTISNKYSVIKQVYDDRVLIRTNNIIHSIKYNSYMFLLSNNSCIWTWSVADIVFGQSQFKDTEQAYLVEIKKDDFNKIKTYEKCFNGFYIAPEDKITSYEQLVELAQEQENMNLISKVY